MVQWTVRQIWICLIGSTCLTLTLSLSGYALWSQWRQKQAINPEYKIIAIEQTGSQARALQTAYLAELLDLSCNQFTSLYTLDCKKAALKLLSSPLISEASVKKVFPGTLYIEYEIRKPIAYLADYQNIGIDREGYLFPMSPFFSPKELPELYLGLPAFGASEDRLGRKGGIWKSPLQNRYFHLAAELLTFLETAPWKEGFRLKKVDVSNAFAPSLGQREIVLFTEEDFRHTSKEKEICCTFPKILRIAPKEYSQQLVHFFTLRRHMADDYKKQLLQISESTQFHPRIIDLRIPQLAFIENH
jgi:hypothetical protein